MRDKYGIYRKKRIRSQGTILLLIGLMTFPLCMFSLDIQKKIPQYVNRTWRELNGISISMITCLAQTREGYLWIGTQGGLIRFDGVKFLKFNTQNTREMKVNFITTLLADHNDMLWIGTRAGLVNFRDGHFFLLKGSQLLSNDIIYSIFEDHGHQIWIGTGEELICYRNQTFEQTKPDIPVGFNDVYTITSDKKDNLWVGTASGLFCFSDGKWISYLKKEDLTGKLMSI